MSGVEATAEMRQLREQYRVRLTKRQRIYLKVRRVLEFVLALTLLVLLALPFLAVAILQKVSSPNEPIFFLQERIGRDDKPFKIIKFRSMKTTAPKSVATGALDHPEQYVSRLGGFWRRTSIDELPQLYNVLAGQMSLVGPRPIIPEEEELQFLRWYYGIYAVPPGMTGLAQVNGRDLVDIYDKIYYDREYAQHVGLGMDLQIIAKSVLVVLQRAGVKDGHVDDEEKQRSVAMMKESMSVLKLENVEVVQVQKAE